MSAFQVHFEPGDKQVTIAQGESVVEAAIRAGLAVNYGCSNRITPHYLSVDGTDDIAGIQQEITRLPARACGTNGD